VTAKYITQITNKKKLINFCFEQKEETKSVLA
jgi:hypothetical protein